MSKEAMTKETWVYVGRRMGTSGWRPLSRDEME